MPEPEPRTRVALLASPGMGHLIPVLELGTRLALHHRLEITVFIVRASSSALESEVLRKFATGKSLSLVVLPPVDVSTRLEPNALIQHKIKAVMRESFVDLRLAIAAMTPRPAALVVDLFGTEALAMARDLGMLGYVFMTTSAWFLSLPLFFSSFDRQFMEDHACKHEPLNIPGCRPVRFDDTVDSFRVFREDVYEDFGRFSREIRSADGVLCNTWLDLEAASLKALREAESLTRGKVKAVPVYTVGPLTRASEPGLSSKVLDWLDKQREESVIYVSFGSGGTLSPEQTTELAWGLELSQQRFIWVVRPPEKNDSAGAFFGAGKKANGLPEYLPEGFVERTGEMGLVVPTWAPQAEILSHPSVGGFMTHCGWNSTMESIVNGVPMIGWPLYAEQKMNAAAVSEDFGVGLRVRVSPEKGVVVREDIEKTVRKIMEKEDREGRAVRERVKELQKSGKKAAGKGGSSYKALCQVAGDCEIAGRERKGVGGVGSVKDDSMCK